VTWEVDAGGDVAAPVIVTVLECDSPRRLVVDIPESPDRTWRVAVTLADDPDQPGTGKTVLLFEQRIADGLDAGMSPEILLRYSPRSDMDSAVLVQRPTGVVGDLPHVAVGVGEGTGRAAPLRLGRRTHNRPAGAQRLRQHLADLFGRADVVGEFDARRAVATERGPQAEHHPAGLEEADFVVGLLGAGPAERLIEPAGPGEIGDAEGHQADALIHGDSFADHRCECCQKSRIRAGGVGPASSSWLSRTVTVPVDFVMCAAVPVPPTQP
jgi:hypothetical protein